MMTHWFSDGWRRWRPAAAATRVRTALLGLALVAVAGVALEGHPAAAAGEHITLTTVPPLSQIHPHGGPSAGIDPDTVIIEVQDASGHPISNVKLDVQLVAPPTNWFVSTDVPRIEGRDILNWSGVSPDGRQAFQYLFPIRGTYHLRVKASPGPGTSASFSPMSQDLSLTISEKPTSVLYLSLFLAVLFLFGTVSGLVLGRANLAARRR